MNSSTTTTTTLWNNDYPVIKFYTPVRIIAFSVIVLVFFGIVLTITINEINKHFRYRPVNREMDIELY